MKFSEAWLREWVNPELSRDDLMAQLTMAGLEVDGLEPVAADFSGVVVGVVEACDKHPDADKLSVCSVSDGDQVYQVVCGAPNVRAGLVTAFARVGAVLPDNFKIKKAKLRGVESHGMLCSAAELGIGDDHDGIMALADEAAAQIGHDVRDILNLDDVIVDLDLTPNRGDCLSLKGLAREVGVLNSATVNYPQDSLVNPTSERTFPVELAAPEGCPRYLGRVIENVDLTKPSPAWMVERLRRCGLRSIDPVVDVTNFILIEQGQPMHAFDRDQISDKIVVRMALAGEKLTLLDGQEVNLDAESLLITDGTGPVAIAGVMGGQRSGVQAGTKNVFLECAFFAPIAIAGTARRYGLHTDASHRYERGVDFALQKEAMERATQLLLSIVGGQAGPVVETASEDNLPVRNNVSVGKKRLQDLLGVAIETDQVDDAFGRLHFDVVKKDVDDDDVTWTIAAPTHRFDIAIEADLVEEVCRIYGYNNIPSKRPTAQLALATTPLEQQAEPALKKYLADDGFQEVITYSFVNPKLVDLLDPGTQPLTLSNPMSSEQSAMRSNLLPGLIESISVNRARQLTSARIFEVGLTFQPSDAGLVQNQMLGGALWGRRYPESWHSSNDEVDFFDIKGAVDGLLANAGSREIEYKKGAGSVLHPGQSADIYLAGAQVGRLGRLHPEVEAQLGVTGIYVFEILADAVLRKPRRQHLGISKFPSVRRDFAIIVDKTVSAAQVESTVRQALDKNLVEFRLFDVYEGKGIDSNEKSLALGLTFQSQTATLTDDEISGFADLAVAALQQELEARLR